MLVCMQIKGEGKLRTVVGAHWGQVVLSTLQGLTSDWQLHGSSRHYVPKIFCHLIPHCWSQQHCQQFRGLSQMLGWRIGLTYHADLLFSIHVMASCPCFIVEAMVVYIGLHRKSRIYLGKQKLIERAKSKSSWASILWRSQATHQCWEFLIQQHLQAQPSHLSSASGTTTGSCCL